MEMHTDSYKYMHAYVHACDNIRIAHTYYVYSQLPANVQLWHNCSDIYIHIHLFIYIHAYIHTYMQ